MIWIDSLSRWIEEMRDDLKSRFHEAVALKEEGDFDSARKILLKLHQDDPASAAILAVLGDVCWELQHLDEAISFFVEAVALKPTSETISLALFHCLWESKRTDDAFNEMKRFLANNESEEYARLLADFNDNL
jgi:predicted Zn-dependent protease